jgi:hypothetical protein
VSRNVQLAAGTNPDIVIELGEAQTPSPNGETPAAPDDGRGGRRIAGIFFISVGAVGLGVGTVLGISVLRIKAGADDTCGGNDGNCTSQDSAVAAESRKQNAILPSWIATGAIGLGAASLAYGIYLVLTSRGSGAPASTGSLRVSPEVGPGSFGVRGSF